MTPYLSVIIVGRNDNYGENFLLRINTFIRSLDYNCKNYSDLLELIVVEWNPLVTMPRLKEVLILPKNFTLKIITVPEHIHESFGVNRPVLEFVGKNVGIRRSKGEYVLVTNPDICFTQEMVDFLATKQLDVETIYRTDRFDYRGDGIEQVSDDKIIDFAISNTFAGHLMNGQHSWYCDQLSKNFEDFPKTIEAEGPVKHIHTNACGDFILAKKTIFEQSLGLWEMFSQKWHLDSYSLYRMFGLGKKQALFMAPYCIFHMDHQRASEDVPFNYELANEILKNSFCADSDKQKYWGLANFNLEEHLHNK